MSLPIKQLESGRLQKLPNVYTNSLLDIDLTYTHTTSVTKY